jgi:hypothetical protein
MSAQAFGSEWAQLESHTFRFKDPLNKDRRFIPLRLDTAPIKGSLAQFLYVNWLPEDREQEYAKLLEACRPPAKPPATETQSVSFRASNLRHGDTSQMSGTLSRRLRVRDDGTGKGREIDGTLAEFEAEDAIILLGDPGMGKTTLFSPDYS